MTILDAARKRWSHFGLLDGRSWLRCQRRANGNPRHFRSSRPGGFGRGEVTTNSTNRDGQSLFQQVDGAVAEELHNRIYDDPDMVLETSTRANARSVGGYGLPVGYDGCDDDQLPTAVAESVTKKSQSVQTEIPFHAQCLMMAQDCSGIYEHTRTAFIYYAGIVQFPPNAVSAAYHGRRAGRADGRAPGVRPR